MSADFTLEPVSATDHAALFEHHRTAMFEHVQAIWGWNEEWQQQNFDQSLASSHARWIVQHGQRVGYCQLEPRSTGIHLRMLVIFPAWQGRGIGAAVLRWLADQVHAAGSVLNLNVFERNVAARRLYEREGWVVCGSNEIGFAMRRDAVPEVLQQVDLSVLLAQSSMLASACV